jgi:hypothetical protein
MEVVLHAAFLGRTGWTPTDPDLIEAREIAARQYEQAGYSPALPLEVREGRSDKCIVVAAVRAAIKRGRELERGGPA